MFATLCAGGGRATSHTHFLLSRSLDHLEEMGVHTWACASCSPFLPASQRAFGNAWDSELWTHGVCIRILTVPCPGGVTSGKLCPLSADWR